MTSKRAAIYARFSSDKQSDRSIIDQVALCRGIAEREGMRVVEIYDDRAMSGASTVGRLGLQRLMRDAKEGRFDVVIAEALDRISRDQEDLAGVHKRLRFAGVTIVTGQDGAASEIHVGVKGMLGALYLKDLADKTRRGQAGVVRDGRHNGGRSYGYRAKLGHPGVLEMDDAEACVVRRIFREYLSGASAREIAIQLNREGVSGPRGGSWNASTISGSLQRQNGILQNELYAGVIVWNRQRFIKDPETGKRVSRPNPPGEWMRAEAEQLRIIDNDTWSRAHARHAARSTPHANKKTARPKHLLSGLISCGCCGSGYIAAGKDKRGIVLRCSRNRETGVCTNTKTVARERVEQFVVEALNDPGLAADEIAAEYVNEYRRALQKLDAGRADYLKSADRRLAGLADAIRKTVDAISFGTPSRALTARLAELEAEQDALLANRSTAEPPSVSYGPATAERFRAKLQDFRTTLSDMTPDGRAIVFQTVRDLVDRVVVKPTGRYKPPRLELHAQPAALLCISAAAGNSTASKVAGEAGCGDRI